MTQQDKKLIDGLFKRWDMLSDTYLDLLLSQKIDELKIEDVELKYHKLMEVVIKLLEKIYPLKKN